MYNLVDGYILVVDLFQHFNCIRSIDLTIDLPDYDESPSLTLASYLTQSAAILRHIRSPQFKDLSLTVEYTTKLASHMISDTFAQDEIRQSCHDLEQVAISLNLSSVIFRVPVLTNRRERFKSMLEQTFVKLKSRGILDVACHTRPRKCSLFCLIITWTMTLPNTKDPPNMDMSNRSPLS